MKGQVCAALVAVGVAVGVIVSAQQATRPTFRAGVNAVVMDVRVVDKSGRFISDLAREDFQVLEDGQDQPITTFDLVDLPPPPPATRSVGSFAPMSDVSSNVGLDEGRLYVIVLDDIFGHAAEVTPGGRPGAMMGSSGWLSTRPPVTIDARILAREVIFHMADADRAAIVTTGGRRDMAQEFTNDKARLVATLDKYVANQGQDPYAPEEASRYSRPDSGGGPFMSTEYDAIKSLKDIAEWLSGVEGRRKAIVLISQRLGSISGDLSLNNWSKRAGLQNLMAPYHIKNLIEATSRANVAIYTLSPVIRAGSDGSGVPLPDEYLQAVAESSRSNNVVTIAQATGGFSRGLNFDGVFERIAAETGSYYLIGFTSSVSKEDGKFHRVEVRTRRSDLGVRSRAGYVAALPDPLARSMIPRNTPLPLAEALQSPASMTGIPMSMAATAYRGLNGKPSLSILVEVGTLPAPSEQARSSAAPIQIAIAAAQVNGKADDVRRIAVGGGTVVSSLAVKPGRYHVRVGAFDADTARRGSLLYDIDVPAFGGSPLTMSGVTLAAAGATTGPVNGSDERWKDQLGMPPTTRRAFSADEVLRGHVEVYDNSRRSPSEIDVVTTVRDATGEPVFTRTQKSVVSRVKGKLAPHQVRTDMPLAGLHAGSFILVIDAARPDGKDVVGSRLLPFTIK